MRTRYAIVDTGKAREAGLDISTLRALGDGERVIVTEAQSAGMEGIELLDSDKVRDIINNK